jgi:hypothetical protein
MSGYPRILDAEHVTGVIVIGQSMFSSPANAAMLIQLLE